eukprot:Sspe_Gene.118235::Locus_111084_Transcript_1_1_Confidence_1.000_Length_665::g.118235::m.118235
MVGGGGGRLGPVEVAVTVERRKSAEQLGMVLTGDCVVSKVVPGSPASVGGVLVGMQVTYVNGRRVTTATEAKKAGGTGRVVKLQGVVDYSGRLMGRVASWTEERGFGMIEPDGPVVIPGGLLAESKGPAVLVGRVFFHWSQVSPPRHRVEVDAVVAFTAVCREGWVRAEQVSVCRKLPSRAVIERGVEAVKSVSWWNVNNLQE